MNLAELEKRIREIDLTALQDYKDGKSEPPILYKAAGLIKSARDMIFVASEETPDRYGDIIQVAGWNFDNFKKNNVFMFNHDYHIAPIGTVPKVWVEGKQLLNTVDWDTADELAKFIKGKYDRGFLKGESVGFRPLEWEESSDGGYIFSKAELLEISAVALPAHPNAIRKALALQEAKSYFFIPSNLHLEKDEPEPEGTVVVFEKPFANEHACRLKSPKDFKSDSFRRVKREHEGKSYSVIMGKLQGEDTMTEQSYRYPKDEWAADDAQKHCKAHDGIEFEPAMGKEKAMHDNDIQGMKEKMGEMKGHMAEMNTLMDEMMSMMDSGESEEEGKEDGKKGQGKEASSETEKEDDLTELLEAIHAVMK